MKCSNFTYEQLAGIAVAREVDGVKVYRAKCTACGRTYDAVVHEGERAPRPREETTCVGVQVGARVLDPVLDPNTGRRREVYEVVGETRSLSSETLCARSPASASRRRRCSASRSCSSSSSVRQRYPEQPCPLLPRSTMVPLASLRSA